MATPSAISSFRQGRKRISSPSLSIPTHTTHQAENDLTGLDPTSTDLQRTTTSSIVDGPAHSRSGNRRRKIEEPTGNKGSRNHVQRVQIEPERMRWARLSDLLRQKDRDRIEDVKEDIDTLLVFAGLFSAVITAFIIESYKNLRQQPEDTTNQILLQMSAQLASLTLNGNSINSTAPSFISPSFTPSRFSIQINTLWSLSLVIALVTASLGILVKQWFHEFMARDTHDPREQIKIRFFRDVGMSEWRVFEIAAFLPLFLQLALLLFLTGLGVSLHELNPIVGWVTTGLILIWFGVFILTALAPAFSSQCPYKTPMLKALLVQTRSLWVRFLSGLVSDIYHHIPFNWTAVSGSLKHLYDVSENWRDGLEAFEEDWVCKDESLDIPVILCAKEVLQGEKLDETLARCFWDNDVEDIVNQFLIYRVKHDHVERGLIPSMPGDAMEDARQVFSALLAGSQRLLVDVGEGCNPSIFQELHRILTLALLRSYIPNKNEPVPYTSLPLFIRLIQEGPTSAAFTILTMYSIRHETMSQHPDQWDFLFRQYLSNAEMQSFDIGDQYILNVVAATRTIIHFLWNRPHSESDVEKIIDCITTIRSEAGNPDSTLPLDPIALTYVFAIIIRSLSPASVVRNHRDDIFEVMSELAEIIDITDHSTWSYSRRRCVWRAWMCFQEGDSIDRVLVPKLCALCSGCDHVFWNVSDV
ncbi:hypothetical protein QCA50_012368 [Cerrena zonata]|uniref:DUF6535 domain-containing protein n=1 Tax=Cerrena zonata TaxID=2478898 RepID=A0AAW0G426_9APHY